MPQGPQMPLDVFEIPCGLVLHLTSYVTQDWAFGLELASNTGFQPWTLISTVAAVAMAGV